MLSLYMLIDELICHLNNARSVGRDNILFSPSLSFQISSLNNWFFWLALWEPYKVQIIYTAIIVSPIFNLLIKTHGQIELFTYHSFNKYSLKLLFHMRPNYFNLYGDLCSLIEYIVDPPFCPPSTCSFTCLFSTLQQFPGGPLLLM